ncbi:hypothetical protein ACFVUS_01605 [Nocardia sp. NPDC058058]|uniref:hypothetical protein n=1 Tax=Nocardia sp. NPDC058058 TaxID=3346317 RepID=UPI0036D94556
MTTNSEPPGRRTGPLLALVVAGLALVIAIVATTYFVLHRNSADEGTPQSVTLPPGTTVVQNSAGVSPPPGGVTAGQPAPSATVAAPGTSAPSATPAPGFAHQPLWPFADAGAAAVWQQSYRDGGHQPWHLDPAATALNFVQGYLGYGNLNKAVLTTTKGEESWVTVGFDNPNGVAVVAAMLHLARIGTGADAPWEVIGTDDRTLSLDNPQYGAKVNSPLAVGGHVTGVDESLRVQVRQLGKGQPVGEIPGIPAGGQNSPWSGSVPFTASCPGTLTVAVATGGHVEAVERFAITGVHC